MLVSHEKGFDLAFPKLQKKIHIFWQSLWCFLNKCFWMLALAATWFSSESLLVQNLQHSRPVQSLMSSSAKISLRILSHVLKIVSVSRTGWQKEGFIQVFLNYVKRSREIQDWEMFFNVDGCCIVESRL